MWRGGGWFGGAEPEKRAWLQVVCEVTLKSRRYKKGGKPTRGCLVKTAVVGTSARSSQEPREELLRLPDLPPHRREAGTLAPSSMPQG